MDTTAIVIIAFGVIFVVGGLIAGQYATKASHKEAEEANKTKE